MSQIIISLTTIPNRLNSPHNEGGLKKVLDKILNLSYHNYEVHLNIPYICKKINEVDLDIEAYSTNDIRGKYVLTFLTWFIKGYLTGSEKNNKELIKERFFQKVQPIQALDDYFKRHIKEAS
jgi:hypothetical protein